MGACTHENCPSWVVKRVVGPLPLLVTKHPSRVSKLVTVLRTVYYKPIHNILPYPLRSYYRYPTMLVWMLPRRVLIKEGEWCLIHGVGGGTCQWAAQMAKIRGFKVIGTVAKGKADVAQDLGCDELIVLDEIPGASYEDYDSVDIVAKVQEVTHGEGVKCVIDGIGKSTVDISIDSLARRGIFVSFGNASGAVPAFPVLRLIGKSAYVTRPKLLDYVGTREELLWRAEEIFGWLKDGKLNVSVDTAFPLDEAADGHKYLEAGRSKGKVLLKIE